ncbi:ring hydroxylating alpha subunit-domain-containing protein [Aspergillus spectabilis]
MNRLSNYLQPIKPSENAAVSNLPSSWYRSEAMYNLGRRAIISKKWLLEGGFSFFLIRDQQGKINGFYNVCRHCANILSCQYHGWPYGFNGDLAKAPRYQKLEGFEKDKNGLFPIHVQTRYDFDHTWDMVGDYNWKTLADNYNEYYHCPTGHPGIVPYTDLSKYWVETQAGHIQHYNTDRPNHESMGIISTFYFPKASMTVSPDFLYLMRCVPISASQTQMQDEVYRDNEASDGAFHKIDGIFKKVLREDKDLCNAAQKNMNTELYIHGNLHSQNEKGPLFFQRTVKDLVVGHHRVEEKEGREVWPATPDLNLVGKLTSNGSDGLLAW